MTGRSALDCPSCGSPLREGEVSCSSCGEPTPTSGPEERPGAGDGAPAPRRHVRTSDEEERRRVEAVLGEGYEVRGLLGRGGFGVVYAAWEKELQREVAVKLLRPEGVTPDRLERFRREARALAGLRHANVLPVFEVGERDGVSYMITPRVVGETLADRLRSHGPLAVEEVVRIGREVAEALDAAHRAGLVHRDVKPENVLLEEPNGTAVLMDFGLAKAPLSADPSLTGAGAALGTPLYMSPEQATGSTEVAPATDIYALGCVVYEMLAGDPPFQGTNARAVLSRHISEAPPSLAVARPDVPPKLLQVVEKALRKVPTDRHRSARELAAELEATLEAEETGTHDPGVGASAPAGSRHAARRTARWIAAAGLIGLAAYLGGAGFSAVRAPAAPTVVVAIVMDGSGARTLPGETESRAVTPGTTVPAGARVVSSAGGTIVLIDRAGRRLEIPPGGDRVVDPVDGATSEVFEWVLSALAAPSPAPPVRRGDERDALLACRPASGAVVTERPDFRWHLVADAAEGEAAAPPRYAVELHDVEGTRWSWTSAEGATTLPDSLPALEPGREYLWTAVLLGGGDAGADTLLRSRSQRFAVWTPEQRRAVEARMDRIRTLGFDPDGDGRLLALAAYEDLGLTARAGLLRDTLFGFDPATCGRT